MSASNEVLLMVGVFRHCMALFVAIVAETSDNSNGHVDLHRELTLANATFQATLPTRNPSILTYACVQSRYTLCELQLCYTCMCAIRSMAMQVFCVCAMY